MPLSSLLPSSSSALEKALEPQVSLQSWFESYWHPDNCNDYQKARLADVLLTPLEREQADTHSLTTKLKQKYEALKQQGLLFQHLAQLDEKHFQLSDIWDTQTCPEQLLPWLAWSLSVQDWDDSWTQEIKRQVIERSIEVHQTKGTRHSLELALKTLGYDVEITEWHELESDNPMPAGTFSISVTTNGIEVSDSEKRLIRDVVNRNKNLRSHLFDINIRAKNIRTIPTLASGYVSGFISRINPYQHPGVTL